MIDFIKVFLTCLVLCFLFEFVFRAIFDSFLHFLFKTCVRQRVGINKTIKYLESKSLGTVWGNSDLEYCKSHLKCLEGEDKDANERC